jgi:hypothetical protein
MKRCVDHAGARHEGLRRARGGRGMKGCVEHVEGAA